MSTKNNVTCDPYRELISAQIDGELDGADETRLQLHLDTCASCQSYRDDAWSLRRSFQVRSVEVSEPANRQVDVAGSLRGVSFLRWALFVIGGTLVLLNAQAVFFADGGPAAHLNRHDGVFGTALGIGMLAVAAKPHRAIGLVPLTSAIALLMAVVAAADLVAGSATMLAEAVHVVEFAGLVCLWVISGGPMRLQRRLGTIGLPVRGHELTR